jgi:formylmethanofuran dehydrogenase subunit C
MANNALYYDAAMNALATLLNSGQIQIYSGSQPALDGSLTGTLLATMTFGATAFGSSSSGVITANTITSGTAVATGTAGYFAMTESNGTTVVGTGTCGATSGFDLNLNSTSIVSGANVSCSSFTITG